MGISDRATILIDKEGKVLWSESVTPSGQRKPEALLAKTKELVG
jgi:peroxiredoxin